MAEKREFVMLAWICPGCETENPGPTKSCTACGAPQPDGVKFQAPSAGFKVVTDPKQIEEAKSGPDIHCGFCGTRNPATAAVCSQCGADMKEGKARKVGDRLDTQEDEGVEFGQKPQAYKRSSGLVAPIPATASYPQQLRKSSIMQSHPVMDQALLRNIGIGFAVALVVAFISWFVYMKWFNVTEVPVRLDGFSWYTEVPIGQIYTYHEEGWSIPAGGRQTSSEEKWTGKYEQKQVCQNQPKQVQTGTERCNPHPVDQGNGYAEIEYDSCPVYTTVQENVCRNENDTSRPINDIWYHYDIDRWTQTRSASDSGLGNQPRWPNFSLSPLESEGFRSVRFVINFTDELNESHTFTSYSQSDWNWFESLSKGQTCYADRNGFGSLNEGIDCRVE